MDHVGPFITTPILKRYILTLVENFTKFLILYTVRDTGAAALLKYVEDFVHKYGLPVRFVTNRGTCFTAKVLWRILCSERGSVGAYVIAPSSREWSG